MERTMLGLTLALLSFSANPVRASHNLDFADTQNPSTNVISSGSPSVQMYIVDSPDSTLAMVLGLLGFGVA